MEKYTVDIDKVLDDFEETEALNVNNKHKNTDGSLMQPSVGIVNSHEENHSNVNQSETNFENDVNSEDNAVNSDKNIFENSLHSVNQIEPSEASDGTNCNFAEKEENFSNLTVKPEISESVYNGCSTASISVSNEDTSTKNHEYQSLDANNKVGDLSSSTKIEKCDFENNCVSLSDSQSTEEKSYESHVKENKILLPVGSGEDTVLTDHSCSSSLTDTLACDTEIEQTSQPHVKSDADVENVEPSEESDSASFFSTNTEKSKNLNVFNNSSSTESNVKSSSSGVNVEMSEELNVASSVSTDTEKNMKFNVDESLHRSFNQQSSHSQSAEGLSNASPSVKCKNDVKSRASTSKYFEESYDTDESSSISNPTGVENNEADKRCECGLHYLVNTFEQAAENMKKSLKGEDSHANSNLGAAASREPNRCDCHRVHPPSFCMHQGMCPHLHDSFAELSAEELQYRQRTGADNSHAPFNPAAEGSRELNRCSCCGVHSSNVCFHQNVRLPIIPIYEDISDEDDDSGVSSEEDISPLFFFNNRMFNYNDAAQRDGRNQNVPAPQNLPGPSHDNQVDLKEAETSKVNNSESSDPVAAENTNSDSSAEFNSEVYPSGSAMNNQSPNKFTGARSKLEATRQSPVNASNVEIEKFSNVENLKSDNVISCKSENQLDENEAISEESLLDNCDNSEKSTGMSSASISSGIQSDNLQNVNTEIKCDNGTISVGTDSLSVTADENECLTLNSDIKTDSFPQRLPRPTTLDLPSRNIAVSEISEDDAVLSENNSLDCVTGPNIVPSEIAVITIASEESLSVRQQPQIGLVKPFWIPDAEAPNCMHCGVKFTVIKRRHHCRACGKVLCSRCCNLKAKLAYLNKEDRICHQCFELLSSSSQNESAAAPLADSQSSSSCGSSPNFSPSPQAPNTNFSDKNTWRPHPNNPDDYCSTIPPLQQVQLTGPRPPPTVLVPIGVLKRGNKARKEPKQVIFSDGIRPGGDLTDLTEPADAIPVYRRMGRKRIERAIAGESGNVTGSPSPSITTPRLRQKRIVVSDEEGPLPPIVLEIDNDKVKDDKLDWNQIIERMQDDDQKPINFALLKNMNMFVKLTKLDCCFGKECWCFTSHGLCAVGQDEIVVILERLPGENTLPRGIIKLFTHIYDSASKGSTFEDLGHIIFPEQILGSSDHRGFLFVRPTFQCLSKLVVPNTPFLVAILIHKWEVPWAKVFPLRLMLRLGAECRYYPCALVSVRHRKPVFFEIGQTIMSVLADLRNYQFTIPVIPGLVVHMEEKKTCVNIPRNRYEKVMKVLNSNNVEHVLALGSNFSSEADSHLVCMQKEEGDYQTQAINIENTTRRVTGASFIVFSGALKSSSGLSAKFSIVEDGLLVQIPQETMVSLHVALRDMKDLTIECGQINAAEPEEVVIVQWTRDDKKFNIGVRSPIDGKSLEGVPNLRIHNSTDYAGDSYLIRWTEVFFLEVDESGNTIQHELVDPCRLAETVAQSCCMALAPYLDQLFESELTKIGLRVTLDSERDRVEYDIGARGKPLPAVYMNAMDCGLIPVILRLSSSAQSEPVSFELIFHILIK